MVLLFRLLSELVCLATPPVFFGANDWSVSISTQRECPLPPPPSVTLGEAQGQPPLWATLLLLRPVSGSCPSWFSPGGFRRKGCELLPTCIRPRAAYQWQLLLETTHLPLSSPCRPLGLGRDGSSPTIICIFLWKSAGIASRVPPRPHIPEPLRTREFVLVPFGDDLQGRVQT